MTKKIKYDILEEEVVKQIKRNRNALIGILGDTGSGKSYAAMKIGEILANKLGTHFDIDNIVFDTVDAVRLIGQLPKGGIIVLDEAGVSFGAREFMTKRNREMSKVIMMFRFKNQVLLWTLPDLGQVDINLRRLMHSILITDSIDYKREMVSLKWFNVKNDRWKGDLKHIYPRIPDGVITRVEFSKPSEDLIEAYEVKKRRVFSNLLKTSFPIKSKDIESKEKEFEPVDIMNASDLLTNYQNIDVENE